MGWFLRFFRSSLRSMLTYSPPSPKKISESVKWVESNESEAVWVWLRQTCCNESEAGLGVGLSQSLRFLALRAKKLRLFAKPTPRESGRYMGSKSSLRSPLTYSPLFFKIIETWPTLSRKLEILENFRIFEHFWGTFQNPKYEHSFAKEPWFCFRAFVAFPYR